MLPVHIFVSVYSNIDHAASKPMITPDMSFQHMVKHVQWVGLRGIAKNTRD